LNYQLFTKDLFKNIPVLLFVTHCKRDTPDDDQNDWVIRNRESLMQRFPLLEVLAICSAKIVVNMFYLKRDDIIASMEQMENAIVKYANLKCVFKMDPVKMLKEFCIKVLNRIFKHLRIKKVYAISSDIQRAIMKLKQVPSDVAAQLCNVILDHYEKLIELKETRSNETDIEN
jgi:hypothetical protein